MTGTAPEGFQVKQGVGEVVIKWGATRQEKKSAGRQVLVCAAALVLIYLLGHRTALLILFGVLLLPVSYQLLVYHLNRRTIRAREDQWIFRRGPLPTLDPDFDWVRFEKKVDPTRYSRLSYSAVVEDRKRQRWGRYPASRGLASVALSMAVDIGVWYHQKTASSSVTYHLSFETRRGGRVHLLSGLTGEQAEFLAQMLQPFLGAEDAALDPSAAAPAGLWWLKATNKRVLEVIQESRAAAAQQPSAAPKGESSPATRRTGAADSRGSCSTCSASQPAGSAFCGECGAPLSACPVSSTSG